MVEVAMISYIIPLTFLVTLLYASYLDVYNNRVIPFKTWLPLIVISTVVTLLTNQSFLWLALVVLFVVAGYTKIPKLYQVVLTIITINCITFFTPEYPVISLLCLVCGVFYAISCFNIFGGADAFALIWIALFIEPYMAIIVFLIAAMLGGIWMIIKKKGFLDRITFIPFILIGFVVVELSQYL